MSFGGGGAMQTGRPGLASRVSSLLLPLLLAACGGGGDEPPPASPPATPAVVTTTNASKLTANVTGSGQTAGIIAGVSVEGGDATQNRSGGLMDLARRLSRIVRDTLVRAEQKSPAQRPVSANIAIDDTWSCDAGQGTVHLLGTLSDNGTGTLQVNFTNCLVIRDKDGDADTNDTINLNGAATMRVDAATVTLAIVDPTDFTLSSANLTLRAVGLSIDASGTLRVQYSLGTTETITANLVSLDNITSKTTRTENLVIVNVYDNLEMPSFYSSTLNGRVIDQDHGYVDLTTPTPLAFGTLTQLFPDSGQIVLTGADSRTVRATALSATLARLQLDLDGNGVVDNTATLKWIELAGPVGADLADSDADGMHDGWEVANGLNKFDPADAALDKDADGAGNLAEYQAGSDPSDPASIP